MGNLLLKAGQGELFKHWPDPGNRDSDKKRLLQQAIAIHAGYPIDKYVSNARSLLKQSAEDANPYAGFEVSPASDAVVFDTSSSAGTKAFQDAEEQGLKHIGEAAFVLVAGGLGERLGYNGIKIALPTELVTGRCFLGLFVDFLLAYQQRARAAPGASATLTVPLAIMTSDDTHAQTVKLLEEHKNFGMEDGQILLIKQEKVPAMVNSQALFALEDDDAYAIQTKPHGHGDVHMLLFRHPSQPAKTWAQQGKKHVFFFQDTNGLVFRALLPLLGVAVERKLTMTTLCIPRHAEDAIGALCLLNRKPPCPGGPPDQSDPNLPSRLTINVEYNQMRALVGPSEPSVVVGGERFSVFPGNSNVFVVNLDDYLKVLTKTEGLVSEFVNPKYQDAVCIAARGWSAHYLSLSLPCCLLSPQER